ncbi:hypothetical protein N8301_03145 [Cyclobacteriaceae bacterium]|nr:hypothetical protein [Cyclobacteriaceae bacterium]
MFEIRICIIFVITASFTLSCEEETIEVPLEDERLIHYDGVNVSAPQILEGLHESSIRFERRHLLPYQGRILESIQFYISYVPDDLTLRIYKNERSSNEPQTLLYEALITGSRASSWNTYDLTEGLMIDDSELWISLRYSLAETQRVIGCDAGPAFVNGDWEYSGFEDNWSNFRTRTNNQISINWNIRGVLSAL